MEHAHLSVRPLVCLLEVDRTLRRALVLAFEHLGYLSIAELLSNVVGIPSQPYLLSRDLDGRVAVHS